MKKYKIEIIETLSRTVEIEADSETDAVVKLSEAYHEEELILNSSDHIGTEFKVVNKDELQ